jgi:hypothetical protein
MSEIRFRPSFLCLNFILKGQTFITANKTFITVNKTKNLRNFHRWHDQFILIFTHFMWLFQKVGDMKLTLKNFLSYSFQWWNLNHIWIPWVIALEKCAPFWLMTYMYICIFHVQNFAILMFLDLKCVSISTCSCYEVNYLKYLNEIRVTKYNH